MTTQDQPEPLDISLRPEPLDTFRDWVYPCGSIPPGTPVIIRPPDDDGMDSKYPYDPDDEEDEEPVGIIVIAVSSTGRADWVSHVVGADTGRHVVVSEHARNMLRQAIAPFVAPEPLRRHMTDEEKDVADVVPPWGVPTHCPEHPRLFQRIITKHEVHDDQVTAVSHFEECGDQQRVPVPEDQRDFVRAFVKGREAEQARREAEYGAGE